MAMFIYDLWSNIWSKMLSFGATSDFMTGEPLCHVTKLRNRKSSVAPKLSILDHMLLHKLYINMAIPEPNLWWETNWANQLAPISIPVIRVTSQVTKITKSPITQKLSHLDHMLLHKSYINMAILDRIAFERNAKTSRKSLLGFSSLAHQVKS